MPDRLPIRGFAVLICAMQVARRRPSPEARFELAPLLDVMFLLLTFFIFAFVIMVRLEVTDITLPPASQGRATDRAPAITLALASDGGLTINGRETSLETLALDLQAVIELRPEAQLLIATDVDARSGDLFELVDVLKAAGHVDLRFLRLPAGGP